VASLCAKRKENKRISVFDDSRSPFEEGGLENSPETFPGQLPGEKRAGQLPHGIIEENCLENLLLSSYLLFNNPEAFVCDFQGLLDVGLGVAGAHKPVVVRVDEHAALGG